jgi:hypothetical protein
MDFIVGLHSIVRWLVVIAAAAAIIRYAIDLAGKSPNADLGRKLMLAYTVLLDVNVLLGMILIVGRAIALGQILPVWLEHATTNLVAVIVAHVFAARTRKMDDPRRAAEWRLGGVVVSLLMVVAGVAVIGGWS